jgi:predicted RNA-binding Zn-ribbon protein involved in translation (DUF1610 family)
METKRKAKGSWGVRFFIVALGIILGLLFYWLLTFVEGDIRSIKGPEWDVIRREFVNQQTDDDRGQLQKEVNALNHGIETLREQQRILNSSTHSLQKTMGQLLSIQQQYIDKGQGFPADSAETLQESQTAFLKNQDQDQQYTREILELIEQRQQKEDTLSVISEKIKISEDDARKKQDELRGKHQLKVGILKLSFLVPVFLVVSFLFMKYRSSVYWPLVWSAFIAAFIKIALVAHKHFPTNYFKYIALLVIIGIVLRILIYLIKMIVAPKKDLLIKQYQQFYDKYLCPVCTKPIKAGPLRYAGWKKKAMVLVAQSAEIQKQEPYTCPSCGTNLYGKCDKCDNIRHTLLPYCEHCGAEKATTESTE